MAVAEETNFQNGKLQDKMRMREEERRDGLTGRQTEREGG